MKYDCQKVQYILFFAMIILITQAYDYKCQQIIIRLLWTALSYIFMVHYLISSARPLVSYPCRSRYCNIFPTDHSLSFLLLHPVESPAFSSNSIYPFFRLDIPVCSFSAVQHQHTDLLLLPRWKAGDSLHGMQYQS